MRQRNLKYYSIYSYKIMAIYAYLHTRDYAKNVPAGVTSKQETSLRLLLYFIKTGMVSNI